MKTFITTMVIILALVGFFSILNRAITKTEYQTCKGYIDEMTQIKDWFISKADYEMCKYHGLDFSEYVKN